MFVHSFAWKLVASDNWSFWSFYAGTINEMEGTNEAHVLTLRRLWTRVHFLKIPLSSTGRKKFSSGSQMFLRRYVMDKKNTIWIQKVFTLKLFFHMIINWTLYPITEFCQSFYKFVAQSLLPERQFKDNILLLIKKKIWDFSGFSLHPLLETFLIKFSVVEVTKQSW